jgi:hypothetical protein
LSSKAHDVAAMMESIMAVAAVAPPRCRPIRVEERLMPKMQGG